MSHRIFSPRLSVRWKLLIANVLSVILKFFRKGHVESPRDKRSSSGTEVHLQFPDAPRHFEIVTIPGHFSWLPGLWTSRGTRNRARKRDKLADSELRHVPVTPVAVTRSGISSIHIPICVYTYVCARRWARERRWTWVWHREPERKGTRSLQFLRRDSPRDRSCPAAYTTIGR